MHVYLVAVEIGVVRFTRIFFEERKKTKYQPWTNNKKTNNNF